MIDPGIYNNLYYSSTGGARGLSHSIKLKTLSLEGEGRACPVLDTGVRVKTLFVPVLECGGQAHAMDLPQGRDLRKYDHYQGSRNGEDVALGGNHGIE